MKETNNRRNKPIDSERSPTLLCKVLGHKWVHKKTSDQVSSIDFVGVATVCARCGMRKHANS